MNADVAHTVSDTRTDDQLDGAAPAHRRSDAHKLHRRCGGRKRKSENYCREEKSNSHALSVEQRNAPFQTVGEVQQVLGMNYDLYEKIESAITIYGGGVQPNPAYAPLEVLLALPGMTPDLAQQLIAARQQVLPGQGAPGQPGAAGLTLPDGTPVVANGGGNTYTIRSRATLANGASTVLDASIRLGGVGAAGQPYTVLRWDQKESSR